MIKKFIYNCLGHFKKNNSKNNLELDDFVKKGLLTETELLRIKRDRAIEELEKLEKNNQKRKR